MFIAEAIKAILQNFVVPLFLIAAIVTCIKARRAARTPGGIAYLFWGELLLYMVGIGLLYTGILHGYFQSMAAGSIGWQPSPFEYELGWFEIGLGCAGVVALWRDYNFRLAVTLPYCIFLFGAAAQHIDEMIRQHNYAPDNAGIILWFGDIAVPIVILALALLSRKAKDGARAGTSVA